MLTVNAVGDSLNSVFWSNDEAENGGSLIRMNEMADEAYMLGGLLMDDAMNMLMWIQAVQADGEPVWVERFGVARINMLADMILTSDHNHLLCGNTVRQFFNPSLAPTIRKEVNNQ